MPGHVERRHGTQPLLTAPTQTEGIAGEELRLSWTRSGREERQSSAVSYDLASAEEYKALKGQEDGVTDVQIIDVKPGK
ncbi:hypothetical protein [Streptomyces sp. V1I6]|uniref:hypothetical protein n=1 Tax=Streptomyces sp. V1I6 TaxID=3042273 RepID=UPI0027D791CE|nr:hypothetical protein [Streptomyces sp. V1I6]